MENIDWVFDGIGTALISFLLGGIIGSGSTYLIVKKDKKIKQKQTAKDNVKQIQIGEYHNGSTITKSGR